MAMNERSAVFIDKDGTLLVNVPYNIDPARMELSPGTGPALRALQEAGYAIVVVSNQSGVARGYFTIDALAAVEEQIRALLAAHGVMLEGSYWCPHHPDGSVEPYAMVCGCRKPLPGMLERAAHECGIDLGSSWMVGDILDDVEAGRRAGCRTVLLDAGNKTEWVRGPLRTPHAMARSMAQLPAIILASEGITRPAVTLTGVGS